MAEVETSMERVEILIEKTHVRIPCMLNPETLTIQRSSGAKRSESQLINEKQTEDPVSTVGRGDTRFDIELMFDVGVLPRVSEIDDVRFLTGALWELTEYDPRMSETNQIPTARFIWGRAWDLRVVVESMSEKYIQFSPAGRPRTSLVSMSLMRVSDPGRQPERQAPIHPLLSTSSAEALREPTEEWELHIYQEGERLDLIAEAYYGHASLWRMIAVANELDNPAEIAPGTRLRIPPLSTIR